MKQQNTRFMIDMRTYRKLHPRKEDESRGSWTTRTTLTEEEMDDDDPPSSDFFYLLPPNLFGFHMLEKRWSKSALFESNALTNIR